MINPGSVAFAFWAASLISAFAVEPDRIVSIPHGTIYTPQVWTRFGIDYCWMGAYGLDEEREVFDIVHNQIEVNSRYRFHDQGLCDNAKLNRLKIKVVDGRSWSLVGWLDIYRTLRAEEPTMQLNFRFQDWDPREDQPPPYRCKDDAYRSVCIRAIALHEFMHAVGFVHEHLRPEATVKDAECLAMNPEIGQERDDEINSHLAYFPGSPAIPVTDYDKESWVNYCNPIYDKVPALSKGDIETLHFLDAATENKIKSGN